MKSKMRIGELAEQAGVTPRTIRYYEDLGLLGPNEREGHGFRYYTETELTRLKKIDARKIAGAVTDGAKRADRFGQRVSSVASSVQTVSETADKAAKKA